MPAFMQHGRLVKSLTAFLPLIYEPCTTMPDLIAQGADYRKRWRRPLPADQAIKLGRGDQAWGVNWNTRISRQHATLQWREGRLLVEIIPGASNPIFYQGVENERFEIQPGEHFVIIRARRGTRKNIGPKKSPNS